MKRVYKFWVYEDKRNPHSAKYLTFASEVINDGTSLANVCSGHINFRKDGSVYIFDRQPEIINEETSPDWEKFFKFDSLYPMSVVKPLKEYDLHLERFDKD